jgi:hypothetical protein
LQTSTFPLPHTHAHIHTQSTQTHAAHKAGPRCPPVFFPLFYILLSHPFS